MELETCGVFVRSCWRIESSRGIIFLEEVSRVLTYVVFVNQKQNQLTISLFISLFQKKIGMTLYRFWIYMFSLLLIICKTLFGS